MFHNILNSVMHTTFVVERCSELSLWIHRLLTHNDFYLINPPKRHLNVNRVAQLEKETRGGPERCFFNK